MEMTEVHPAIQKYLTALSQRLKEIPGVVPEEGLADAQEFLLSEWESLCRRQSALSEDELYQHFVRRLGSPDDVAAEYAAALGTGVSGAAENESAARDTENSERSGNDASHSRAGPKRSRLVVLSAALAILLGCFIALMAIQSNKPTVNYSNAYGNLTWAKRVVSFMPGKPMSPKSNDPKAALGPLDCQDIYLDFHTYVTLGHGGELILEFTDVRVCDGDGPDLVIFEVGPSAESINVAVSRDGGEWIKVGRTRGSNSTIDLAPYVKPGDCFRFVRITDAKSGRAIKSDWPGADIDAVGAVHVVRAR